MFIIFYRSAQIMSAVYLSHAGVVSKWLNVSPTIYLSAISILVFPWQTSL